MAGAGNYASDLYTQSELYPYFMGLFSVGCFFLFLSIWFLPFIVVAPRKCANLINVGSILILASFALIKGPKEFLLDELLCNKQKFIVSWLYVLSLIATLYAAMVMKSYVLTLVSLAIEVICLLYFVCSYFPGGQTGMKYML